MPNWCFCKLSVYGLNEERYDFMEFVKGESNFDYNTFIPYPEKYANADKIRQEEISKGIPSRLLSEDGYNHGGYEWCLKTWGTKWNASMLRIIEREKSILYEFDSPWAPPIPVIIEMAKIYPKLRFILKYNEPGVGMRGTLYCKENIVKEY
jgi:hypothetical protein